MDGKKILTPLTFEEKNPANDMVAAAVYVDAGEPSHAALIIHHNGEVRSFHFFGSVLLDAPSDETSNGLYIFIKELDFIPSFLVPSFLAHCELIATEANPKYGFFYDPRSFYDASGNYQNPGAFPEYMTCVGFCLTVIQSYLIDVEFLYYQDWDQKSYDLNPERMAYQMLQIQKNHPNLKPEDLLKAVRRILPIEYFSGAYGPSRPVRKTFTDKFSKELKAEIAQAVA